MTVKRRRGLGKAWVVDIARQAGFILLSILDPANRECMRRCAVATTFSRATYDDLLRPEGAWELDQLIALGQLAPAPVDPERYGIAPSLRDAALGDWWNAEDAGEVFTLPVPPGLAELARELADRVHAEGRELEELELRLLHDPVAAASLLTKLFNDADQQHDLSRCELILDVLNSNTRRSIVPPEIAQLGSRLTTHLAARQHWATEFYKSAFYIRREDAEASLEAVLTDQGPRLTELYATGGMGKTMQLRWFIARRCVPEGIACARLDFELIQPMLAARHPWLLLLEAAAELDGQLERRPFQELLAAHGHYRNLLSEGDPRWPTPQAVPPGDAEDVKARFIAALRRDVRTGSSDRGTRPVVLVADTFEDVLHPSVDSEGILNTLTQVLKEVPQLRIVVAGRYSLLGPVRSRLPATLPEIGSCKLEPLTTSEQRQYLAEIRGIADADVIERIVRMSEGSPLTLSIYAELVARSPRLTADEVAGWVDPGVVGAIKRYVQRIPDRRIRWLIRYGVVVRRLSFDLVSEVLWPMVSDAMTGRSDLDDPEQDADYVKQTEVFTTDQDAAADLSEVRDTWTALYQYASDDGWLRASKDEPTALMFRSDLARWLREVIRHQRVFSTIQAKAAEYFERRAAEDPTQWLTWTREALYHRLHQDTETGLLAWKRAIALAREDARDDWCHDLATSILHERDFVDEKQQPTFPLDPAVLADVHYERARAASTWATTDRAGPEDRRWSDAEAALKAVRLLEKEHPEIELPATSTIEARLWLGRGDADRSARLIRQAKTSRVSSPELVELERTLGMARLKANDPQGLGDLEASYRGALKLGDRAGARESLVCILQSLQAIPDYAGSLEWLRRARRDRVVELRPSEFALFEATILAQLGLSDAVEQLVTDHNHLFDGPERAAAILVRAWAYQRSERYLEAVAACEDAHKEFDGQSWLTYDDASMNWAIRGFSLGQILRVEEGTAYLLAAAARAGELRLPEQAAQYAAAAAHIQLVQAGDLDEAAQCVDEAERSAPTEASDGWLDARLTAAALHWSRGEAAAAQDTVSDVMDQVEAGRLSPGSRVSALVSCLYMASEDQRARVVSRLIQSVHDVPPSARTHLIDELRQAKDVRLAPDDAQRLRELLHDDVRRHSTYASLTPFDRAAFEWRAAEVLRVCGFADEARVMLEAARSDRGNDLFAWWRWLDGMGRLGDASADEPAPGERDLEGPSQLLAACQVVLAERRMNLDDLDVTQRRLDRAERAMSDSARPTHWSARLAAARAALNRRREDDYAARRSASEAATAYGRLGDARRVDQVSSYFRLGRQIVPVDDETLEVRFATSTSGQVDVDVIRPDGTRASGAARLPGVVDTRDFRRTLKQLRDLLDPLTGGWESWSANSGERILTPDLLDAFDLEHASLRDVRLVFEGRELAAMPWELIRAWNGAAVPLVLAPSTNVVYRSVASAEAALQTTKSVQRALAHLGRFDGVADGIVGGITLDALRGFQADAGLDTTGYADRATWVAIRDQVTQHTTRQPLRAVVLQMAPGRELGRQRGYAALGVDPAAAYVRCGWDVDIYEDFTQLASLSDPEVLGLEQPHLVHIVAPIRLSSGRTILDLGGDAATRRFGRDASTSSMLSVTGLRNLLGAFGRGAPMPVVLLDIPLPESPLEQVRALALRNSFAHQLLRLGAAGAILGSGLADGRSQLELLERILSGLAEGRDIGAVARAVQRVGATDPDAALPFCATALHLDRPPFTWLPLGYMS